MKKNAKKKDDKKPKEEKKPADPRKVVLITGCSRGIGLTLVDRLLGINISRKTFRKKDEIENNNDL